jgi:hypothetical protein
MSSDNSIKQGFGTAPVGAYAGEASLRTAFSHAPWRIALRPAALPSEGVGFENGVSLEKVCSEQRASAWRDFSLHTPIKQQDLHDDLRRKVR